MSFTLNAKPVDFIVTAIKFRYAQTRKQSVKKMKPQRTETGLGRQESVRGGSIVGPDHHQGDDAGL
jgi:hypothetical protein